MHSASPPCKPQILL